MISIAGRAPWLENPDLQRLLAALSADGETARVAGGAVRNALMGLDTADVDVATTTVPDETVRRLRAAGFKSVPTGIEHGTVTAVAESGRAFEVTTLRADIETDGRRAKVRFGTDWAADAARRDFTINALYADADGTVHDLVGGVADIEARRLRFIGDPEDRIREDYLRILRFFRFFAWYGSGRPDAEGLKACARLKEGLARLSAERVAQELRRLLSAPDPSRALLWMRQASVLTTILPEGEKWGIDLVHGLVEAERSLGWPVDSMLRLSAILPPDVEVLRALSDRLRLSRAEAERLEAIASTQAVSQLASSSDLYRRLYREGQEPVIARLRLQIASARQYGRDGEATQLQSLLDLAGAWDRPRFPVSGQDLKDRGHGEGRQIGGMLAEMERRWIAEDFRPTRETLLDKADDPKAG